MKLRSSSASSNSSNFPKEIPAASSLPPEILGLFGCFRDGPTLLFCVLRRISGLSFSQVCLSGHDLLAKFFCSLQGEMLMVTRENRPPLAFGVIGCHIVAGGAAPPQDPVLPDPEQHTVLASLKCSPVPAYELDFFSFAHRVVSPFQFFRIRCPPAGACLCVGG